MSDPQSVYEQYWADLETNYPKPNFEEYTNPDNPWLPKTDWSRDRIIANED